MPNVHTLDVSAAEPEKLVRFALASWYWHSTGSKVEPIARVLGLGRTATVEWIKRGSFGSDDRRRQLQLVEDALGTDSISRLWRTIAAPFDQKFVLRADPQWWPDLRRHARFRCAVDVLVSADAAIEDLGGTPPDQLRPADRVAVERVAAALAQVQAGPYGFMSDAYLRLVLLLPYALDAITDFCVRSPVGFRVLRTFDRGLRRYPRSEDVARAAHALVDHYFEQPVSLRSVNQLRLARRAAWYADGAARVRTIASRLSDVACQRPRDLLQRRCAAWYLAELSGQAPVGDIWGAARSALAPERAIADVAGADVATLAAQTREVSRFRRADFVALPEALPTTRDGETVLVAVLGTPARPRASRDLAKALQPATVALVGDALRTPCPIRWRTIVETLHACSAEVQAYVVARLCEVADAGMAAVAPGSIDHLVQRALLLLANLQGDRRSLATLVDNATSAAASPPVRATAVWGIGDVLLSEPRLPRDKAMAVVERSLGDPSPTVRQAAIHSVASTRDSRLVPVVEHAAIFDSVDHPDEPETARWVDWAITLLRNDSL